MTWLLWIAAVSMFLFYAYHASRAPIPYRGRACTGRAWKRAFPVSSKEQIRTFLQCFVDGMAIPSTARLKFHPGDQVLAVYRALYSGRTPWGDQMECELFLEDVAAAFDKRVDDLLRVWHTEVTLGELFAFASAAQTDTLYKQGASR